MPQISGPDVGARQQFCESRARLAAFGMPNLAGFSDPLSRPEFWESVAEQVFDDLLVQYLQVYQPIVFLVLRAWNVIRYDPVFV